MSTVLQLTEAAVRQLRDNIYRTEPRWGSDAGWEACRENWLRPENVAWLLRQPQNAAMREGSTHFAFAQSAIANRQSQI